MSAAEHKALIFLLKNLNISTYFFYILTFLFFPLNTLAVRYRRQYYQQQPEVYSTFNSEQFTSQQLPLSQQPPSPNTQKQQFTAYNEPYARRLLALAAGAYSPTPPNGYGCLILVYGILLLIKVNKYFARAFNTLWPSVKAALEDPRHSGYKVTFTGHSLGVQLYTFGQPRVGNTDFAAAHDKYVPLSFRVVHRMDIVPHMPACDKTDNWPGVRPKDDSKPCDPTSKGKAYHHGVEIWYPYGMKSGDPFYECLRDPKDEDFTCSDSLSFEVSKYKTYISDHRHYFDHKVPRFGKLGCDPNLKELEEAETIETNAAEKKSSGGFFANLAGKVKTLGKLIGTL